MGPNWATPGVEEQAVELLGFLADRVAKAARVVQRAGIRPDDRGRRAEGLLGGGERLRVAARDDDPRAFALQELGGGEADAAGAAGDEQGLVFHGETVFL